MGRCNGCRKQGYMNEKLQCLGSVCNFCNMACLLQYCYLHFETSQHTTSSNGTNTAPPVPSAPAQPHHSSKMNPVIADVVSLANGSASQPSGSANTALTGELPTSNIDGKNLDHASTQTDAMRAPAPRRRQMKNKSVLCRPFTTDQEIMCQLPSSSPESKVLLDSSSQSDQPSRSPAHSPKFQGETEPSNLTPARLTGRHFLGKRDNDSNCKVCAQRRKSKLDEEEPDQKKRRMEDGDDELEKKQEISVNEERNDDDEEERKSEIDCGRMKRQTPYYCKTCTEEPTLCPVPCFELYHTKRDYEAPAS
ncbi:hypothetical protein AMECASPLE_013929 [Ameca splendens]|uniref:PiggyBac transposable element-derived protein 4 C-terminal zinc-finger domain-containing protein n=1 Tax=Ameca splendens TaxID=208324 RepID=A0ABV0XQC5_9TELE